MTVRTSQVARLQQVAGVACLVGAFGSMWWWRDEPAMAWLALGAPVGLFGFALAVQFVVSVAVSRHRQQPVPWTAALIAAWWHELVTALKVFGWHQPWRWQRWSDVLPPASADPVHNGAPQGTVPAASWRGVLLVHGFMCNRGLWDAWQADLARRASPVVAVNLEPYWGSIDDYVVTIEDAVANLTRAGGCPPLVVAHSMGGLAMRAWLRATPDGATRVAHIVTVGTPHQGTWLAQWCLAPNARQMQLDSPWLRELARQEPAELGQLFTCWHSCADNIVFPLGTAVLPGSNVRYLPHVGHVALVNHPQVRAETLARLDSLSSASK